MCCSCFTFARDVEQVPMNSYAAFFMFDMLSVISVSCWFLSYTYCRQELRCCSNYSLDYWSVIALFPD